MNSSPNILLFGSCRFSKQYLERLLSFQNIMNKNQLPIFSKIGVVHPCNSLENGPLLEFCRHNNIPTYSVPKNGLSNWNISCIYDHVTEKAVNYSMYDVAIVASFDHYIPSRIINSFSLGAFNIHPSLLPKYRGASPMQTAIANMDKITGVSVVTLSAKYMDRGKILAQSTHELSPDTTFSSLSSTLANIGANDTAKILKDLENSMLEAQSQNEDDPNSKITAPKFDSNITRIDFDKMTANQIYALYRAYSYIYPITVEFYSANKISWIPMKISEILNPDLCQKNNTSKEWEKFVKNSVTGGVIVERSQNVLWVKCAHDTWLPCKKFKLEGKFLVFDARTLQGYGIKRCNMNHFRKLY